jgi:hypothetical protein
MLWFTVWTLLVLGTLTGAFFLGRDLWRKATALGHELRRASDAVAQLSEKVAALAEATADVEQARATLFDDKEPLRERLTQVRRAGAARASVRAARHQETFARWRAYSR